MNGWTALVQFCIQVLVISGCQNGLHSSAAQKQAVICCKAIQVHLSYTRVHGSFTWNRKELSPSSAVMLINNVLIQSICIVCK